MKRSNMTAKVTEATVTWQDETCRVGYRVGAITPDSLAAMAALATQAEDGSGEGTVADRVASMIGDLAAQVSSMVAWWEVEDDDGEPLPATPEVAATLPLSFLRAVISTGQEAMRPPTGGN